jgi:hypothetical protein
MKTIAALLALALATVATVRPADACGDYGSFSAPVARETAVGVWPQLSHDRDGRLHLSLGYPRFAVSGEHLYMSDFALVPDARLRRFERALAAPGARDLVVTVEEVEPGLWRVRSWKKQNRGA